MNTEILFEIINLSKHITLPTQTISILNNINFNIKKKEILAIKGVSGVGKSTLLKIISGIERASSGAVLFSGEDITKLNNKGLSEYRLNKLGMVFQDFRLFEHLTVLENVMLPCELQGKSHKDSEALANEALKSVSMLDRAFMFPKTLSGGEKQRVAIARAWVSKPKIIIADEPTGQLDQISTLQILELMKNINIHNDAAIVVATHDPLVVDLCHRVLEISNGTIKEVINEK